MFCLKMPPQAAGTFYYLLKRRIIKVVKKPIFIIAIIVLIAVLSGYFYFFRNKEKELNFFVVKKGDVLEEVSVTGRVEPFKSVDLAFEKSGRVVSVFTNVGNYVSAGDVLVKQDNSELSAQLEKAEADLETQKANLKKSEIVLNNYYLAIPDILNDAYIKADDAVRNQAGSMFTDAESDTPKVNFSSTNSQAVTDSQNSRLVSRAELSAWRQELAELNSASSNENLFTALAKSKARLSAISSFLTNLSDALEKATGLSQSTLDSYKASITTGRTNVNTVATNISDQKQDVDSQKATIASEGAAVKSYQAGVSNIESQISKTILYSPINGVITKQDAKIGEIAAANAVLLSIISAQYEIEANIPEVDIAGIKIGNTANITLDAYGSDENFAAKVFAIDPAEKIIEGVATYKTTLRFVKSDGRVKSGMTANIDILKNEKSGVLIVPQRLVSSRDGEKFVNIIDNGSTKEVKIITDLRGSDGNIEVVEGLKEGDYVSY